MKFRFYLDGALVDEPKGVGDMVTSITRARDINGLLIKQDISVTFTGTGYDALRTIYDQVGWTGKAECFIEYSPDDTDNYRTHYKGYIFVRDVEWDLKRKYAKTPIVDNSWYARLNNNKSIKINPSVATSKNGVAITPATTYSAQWYYQTSGVQVTDAASNVSYAPYYILYDFLEYTISYLSDGELLFDSGVFGDGGEFEFLNITNGFAFRSAINENYNKGVGSVDADYINENYNAWQKEWVGTTLEELLKNISKLGRYSFIIDYSTSKPTFRIEQEKYFEDDTKLLTCNDINELKERTEAQYLYSKVKFGSGKVINTGAGWSAYAEDIPLLVFYQEEFAIETDANIDNTLDLQLTYITSANVIEDIASNRFTLNDDYYDNDIILWYVETTVARDSYPYMTNWLAGTLPPQMYNYQLTNAEIARRYLGGIPLNLLNQLPVTTDERFLAFMNADQQLIYPGTATFLQPLIVDNDSTYPAFDTGGNFNTGTYQFTAGSTGTYSFFCVVNFYVQAQSIGNYCQDLNLTINAVRYDSGASYLTEYVLNNTIVPTVLYGRTYLVQVSGSNSINMTAGDYLEFELEVSDNGSRSGNMIIDVKALSYFECTSSPSYQYNIATYDPLQYAVTRYEFAHGLSDSEWRTIVNNPRGYIEFNLSGQQPITGRIESLKMNHRTGKAQFLLNSKKKTT